MCVISASLAVLNEITKILTISNKFPKLSHHLPLETTKQQPKQQFHLKIISWLSQCCCIGLVEKHSKHVLISSQRPKSKQSVCNQTQMQFYYATLLDHASNHISSLQGATNPEIHLALDG